MSDGARDPADEPDAYLLGTGAAELNRLGYQHQVWQEVTERLWAAAGFGLGQTLLDLGCGQGLLASWLRAARQLYDAGQWQTTWPEPPRLAAYRGIELMPSDVLRASVAGAENVEVVQGDIRTADFG